MRKSPIALCALLVAAAHAGTITLGPLAPDSRAVADGVNAAGYTDRQLATFTFALQQRMNSETALLLSDDKTGPSRNEAWALKAYCGELWQVSRFAASVRLSDLSQLFDAASANCQDRVKGLDKATFRKREQDIIRRGAMIFGRYGLVTADDFSKALAEMPGQDEVAIQTIGNRMIERSKAQALDGNAKVTSRPSARIASPAR